MEDNKNDIKTKVEIFKGFVYRFLTKFYWSGRVGQRDQKDILSYWVIFIRKD